MSSMSVYYPHDSGVMVNLFSLRVKSEHFAPLLRGPSCNKKKYFESSRASWNLLWSPRLNLLSAFFVYEKFFSLCPSDYALIELRTPGKNFFTNFIQFEDIFSNY